MGRENPLGDGRARGVDRQTERLRGDLPGLRLVEAPRARLGGDVGFAKLKRGASGGPVAGGALAGELLEERVDGGSQGAGEQSTLVTGVKDWGDRALRRNRRLRFVRSHLSGKGRGKDGAPSGEDGAPNSGW